MQRGSCLALVAPLLALAACQPTASPEGIVPTDVDFVLVDKSDRTLTVYLDDTPIKTYRDISFGDAPSGHKQFEGDERTPQGRYTIDARNPNSAFHLSLRISYPNAQDRAFAEELGRSPGGDIFIHGQPNRMTTGQISGNWTDGCIAVSNGEIQELWNAIPNGTPIEIQP